jgi:hypothetical protein
MGRPRRAGAFLYSVTAFRASELADESRYVVNRDCQVGLDTILPRDGTDAR